MSLIGCAGILICAQTILDLLLLLLTKGVGMFTILQLNVYLNYV